MVNNELKNLQVAWAVLRVDKISMTILTGGGLKDIQITGFYWQCSGFAREMVPNNYATAVPS